MHLVVTHSRLGFLMFMDIKVASFNCRGIKNSVVELQSLMKSNDIICLQETWLYDFDAPFLNQISNDFIGRGVFASKSADGIAKGRPSGGLAILWRKSLANHCSIQTFEDETRIMGICIVVESRMHMIINVYLPVCSYANQDDFIGYLSKIDDIILATDTPFVTIVGDFNADLHNRDNHMFGKDLYDHCTQEGLVMSDSLLLPSDTFTCFSEAHHTTSWLDHVISTSSAHASIGNICVDYKFVTSDHFPLQVTLRLPNQVTLVDDNVRRAVQRVKWDTLSPKDIDDYTERTKNVLGTIDFPHELALCDNTECKNPVHISLITTTYTSLCDKLLEASEVFHTPDHSAEFQIPGWTDCCSEAHRLAREAFLVWRANNRPRHGVLFDNMRVTRAHFKYLLRQCKIDKDSKVSDSIAKKLLSRNSKSFWSEIKKVTYRNANVVSNTIGGISGENDICIMWADHFRSILNSSKDKSMKTDVTNTIHEQCNGSGELFQLEDISAAVKELKKGKSCGTDGLSGEHVIYAHNNVYVYIRVLFNAMLCHGFIPHNLMSTILVPLLKDKKGDISAKNNYRPIAITNVMSKLLEILILQKYRNVLVTTDNQFGFKEKHSTDMCCFILKEVIDFYISSSTPVYLCFMDASKAFDKVNHYHLFNKLIKRGLPALVIRLLMFWYSTQEFLVRWCNSVSPSFTVSNGVRQGGILSPYLYNVFVDELSSRLTESRIGCCMDKHYINHLFYADDSVLMAPSPTALQTLINTCESFASEHELTYNCTKTVCMTILPKHLKELHVPKVSISGSVLSQVSMQKYLGVFFTNDRLDDEDMKRELRSVYSRGNILLRKFRKCNDSVKIQLFRSYCMNFYCSALWCFYSNDVFNKLKVAYNNTFRVLFSINGVISISSTFMCLGIDTFKVILRKSMSSLLLRTRMSENRILQTVCESTIFLKRSRLYKHWLKHCTLEKISAFLF